ncbi:hypothetical protein ACC785_37030, partial [Rhizobium ruizarguesonis]
PYNIERIGLAKGVMRLISFQVLGASDHPGPQVQYPDADNMGAGARRCKAWGATCRRHLLNLKLTSGSFLDKAPAASHQNIPARIVLICDGT